MKKLILCLSMTLIVLSCGNKSQNKGQSQDEAQVQTQSEAVVHEPVEEIVSTFNYVPPVPQDGKLKGVVEMGAAGFNFFIINIDKEKNWKLEKAKFGESGVYDNIASETDVLNKLKAFIKDMVDFGVRGTNIHFVVSSGAAKEEAVVTITAALKKIGYIVNTVSPEQEGTYALRSVLPKQYEKNGFVVDMGSSNTKISWLDNGKTNALETLGSRYKSREIADSDAFQTAAGIAKQIPENHREICFIIGGVPYAMANSHRKEIEGVKERYTVLKSEKGYTSEKFQDDRSIGGLNIYKAIRETTGCKMFVFDFDANFTIGFLLTIPY